MQSSANLCEGAHNLQPTSHGGREPALAAQGGEQQAILRAVRLVGTVAASKLLQALVSRPRQLQSQVHPPALVLRSPAAILQRMKLACHADQS